MSGPSEPKLPRQVIILCAIGFVAAVGFGIQAPSIPVFATELGVNAAGVGILVSGFAVARLITGPAAGRLVNRFGETRVLVPGTLLLAASSFGAGLAPNFETLLAMRAVGGIGSSMFTVGAMTLIYRVTPPDRVGTVIGYYQGAFQSGTVIGPVLGSLLTLWSIRAPFFAYGVTATICGVVAVIFVRSPGPLNRESRRQPFKLRKVLRDKEFRVAMATYFAAGWASFGLRVSVIPVFLLDVMQGAPSWIGVGLATGAIVQVILLPFAGRWADRWRFGRSLLVGDVILVVAYVVLLAAPSVPGYLITLALLGAGVSFVTTGGARIVARVSMRQGGGVTVGLSQSSVDAGMVAGPLIAGFLAEHFGFPVAFGVTMGVVVLAAGMTVSLRRGPAE